MMALTELLISMMINLQYFYIFSTKLYTYITGTRCILGFVYRRLLIRSIYILVHVQLQSYLQQQLD